MKKFFRIVCVMLLLAIITTGCKQRNAGPQDDSGQEDVKITYSEMRGDYEIYQTLESLAAAGDYAFEGKVTKVYFEVLNHRLNQPDDMYSCCLNTIYEVEVIKSFKGENNKKARVIIMGGLPGVREAEQIKAIKDSGLFPEGWGIPIVVGMEHPTVGKTYLFLTNEYHRVINPSQYALEKGVKGDNEVFTYEEVKAYLTEHSK